MSESADEKMQARAAVSLVRDKMALFINNQGASAEQLRVAMAQMVGDLDNALALMESAAPAPQPQPHQVQWTVENLERELHRVSQPIKPPDTNGPHRVDC